MSSLLGVKNFDSDEKIEKQILSVPRRKQSLGLGAAALAL